MSRPDLYFALIHARQSFPNEWVGRFYRRLDEEVRSRATPLPGLRTGSIHYATEREAQAASGERGPDVRVLVPLYTREFLHDPPTDFAPYLNRRSDVTDLPFVHPVMWDVYIPPREVCGIAQAVSLGNAVREYRDCGMATICRHNAYSSELRQIVELLADRIVRAAEHPGHVPEWMLVASHPVGTPLPEARFFISVARPPGSDTEWTPFEPDRLSVIDRAVQAARRLALLPEVIDAFDGPAADHETRDSAGILLLAPETLADATTRPIVEKLLKRLPQWTTVVVVAGRDQHLREPAARAMQLAGSSAQVARTAPEFARTVEEAIQRARRNFLRGHPS
ncbi:hypothetical protein [Actinoplanes regularis]|uniref:Uncharacterized protein n=1 Tax=Actinoplanes regularis TaxID=52697 RepID=A0A239B8M3_9ACTN|nr:hypothetical protein [Actinoplanes regularis]GIE87813.1 hypothetical protein Are01nite_42930 [Actinoplanes regularis]SNS03891.1 hypothetical protein SAMN06264365_10918 [Actinoplanes regularis]